ncbi:MAG TPA: hypothetical protein VGP72_28370 [Planctomycetota bacterium]
MSESTLPFGGGFLPKHAASQISRDRSMLLWTLGPMFNLLFRTPMDGDKPIHRAHCGDYVEITHPC